MNHTITLGGLLLVLLLIGGLGTAGFGALMLFGAGMSDNMGAGQSAERQGCITALVGVVLCGIALAGLLS